ncbi:protein-export membrane protein SecD [Caldalkalibacillus thermarum TA2.A1]|uniref:Protein translocase subunit SecD n=1 Tax=Caldalkalibacillus thermarum (strain TA2.A1) TaxID=986075 RepID=F5LAR2_CALTT|nr:protein translocase subunit SecD [Caldalkalibacillus thermarum]EGL81634.1 protein-export membrane protein SecD [Caldalkalibacillus thermarum TA2.A1]
MRWSMIVIFLAIVIGGFTFMAFSVDSVISNITLGLDLQGGFEILYKVVPVNEEQQVTQSLLHDTYTALYRRVDAMGVSEPDLRVEGEDRIRVRLAGVHDPEEARRFLSTEARLSFRNTEDEFLFGGEHLKEGSARAVFDEYNRPIVMLEFKDPDLIRQITSEYLHDIIVIWLDFDEETDSFREEMLKEDPKFLSAPEVKSVLSTEASITGFQSYEEAEELASLLNAGALPVQLEELTARSVSPTLGERALDLTVRAGMIGGALIALYMLLYYRLPGLVAALALFFYVYFILVVFNWMNAVLTLPGIAALVLGIGMAVDANIITNERIKEEIRSGKTIMSSFRAGSKRSLRTIMDANITTIIAAGVLFYFGDFAIQGFALMLIVSIVLSLVTAVLGSRLLLGLLVASRAFDNKPRWFGVKESEISEL